MKDAKEFRLNSYTATIECPHCGHSNDGWLSDPRGSDTECDECGKQFNVPEDIEVTIQ